MDSGIEFDLLFGPAYKGIPIATTTAVALAEHHDKDLPYCFNRKEAKDHGEGGSLVGSALQGRVMLVDDVITAGTAIRESMEIIQAHGATLAGVLISLDRQERGRGEISAIQEVERDYGCKVISIITLKDLIAYLEENLIWLSIWRLCEHTGKNLACKRIARWRFTGPMFLSHG